MLKIAITGNIASGKSKILQYFKEHGFACLSLDLAVHKIYEQDDFKKKLIELFKTSNRVEIAKIVFLDKQKMKMLEDLIYPEIKIETERFFATKDVGVVEVPMLFESGFDKMFDKIIFISAKKQIRKKRLIQRNNLTIKEADLRINFQEDECKKIQKSDFVIYNNGNEFELELQFKKVLKTLNI